MFFPPSPPRFLKNKSALPGNITFIMGINQSTSSTKPSSNHLSDWWVRRYSCGSRTPRHQTSQALSANPSLVLLSCDYAEGKKNIYICSHLFLLLDNCQEKNKETYFQSRFPNLVLQGSSPLLTYICLLGLYPSEYGEGSQSVSSSNAY